MISISGSFIYYLTKSLLLQYFFLILHSTSIVLLLIAVCFVHDHLVGTSTGHTLRRLLLREPAQGTQERNSSFSPQPSCSCDSPMPESDSSIILICQTAVSEESDTHLSISFLHWWVSTLCLYHLPFFFFG